MSDRPRKAAPSTAAIDSDDADGTVTAWSLATFTLSVPSPRHFLVHSSPLSRTRWLMLAGLLVMSPRLLIFMAGEPRTLLTPLEAFLAFQLGITLFAVSVGVLVNVRAPSGIYLHPYLQVQRLPLALSTHLRRQTIQVDPSSPIRYSPLSPARHSCCPSQRTTPPELGCYLPCSP